MELVGVAEIAELFGVSKQVVSNWRGRRASFPSPVANLKSGPVWKLDEIVAWGRQEGVPLVNPPGEASSERNERSAVVTAMMNMKGGVGKSTLTANIGWHAAFNRNLRVLLVDLDPQFNLSQYILGVDQYARLLENNAPTIEAIFNSSSSASLEDIIHHVRDWQDGSCLHLAPASLELAWSVKLAVERAHVLRDSLDDVRSNYDVIIIDCSPTESVLSWAVYFAADYIFVPVRPEFLSTIGLPLLIKSLNEFQRVHRQASAPEIAGLIFNGVSDKSEHIRSRRMVMDIAKAHGLPVLENSLSHSESYPAGARHGKPIFMTDNARYQRKDELVRVGDEFLARIGL